MNETKLHIQNFKCFIDIEILLKNLTVFIGPNSTGKSSILQSIVLYLQGANRADDCDKASISLYHDMGYDMGVVESLLNATSSKKQINIGVGRDNLRIDIDAQLTKLSDVLIANIKKKEITYSYLCAERIGPRNVIEYHKSSNCGVHGEYTAYVIASSSESVVAPERWFDSEKPGFFSVQLDNWLNFIFPGTKIKVDQHFNKVAQISMQQGGTWRLPTHLGFGMSYALPIITDGLTLSQDAWFVVENPEAHLQPKAQTQIGYFLAQMADAGIRVVMETHSEHVLEGIIAYKKSKEGLIGDDFCSLYMVYRGKGSNEPKIELKKIENKNIQGKDFPSDFFAYTADTLLKEKSETSKMLDNFGL